MTDPNVKLDLRALEAFAAAIRRGSGEVRKGLKLWAMVYRSFAQRRYRLYMRGGGDWPRLSKGTLAARRRRASGKLRGRRFKQGMKSPLTKAPKILYDTGTLFRALEPRFLFKPGQFEEDLPLGVRVGYGGPHRHGRGKATIADIANWHQTGAGRLPVRKIIVPPDAMTVRKMVQIMTRAMLREANRHV